jgi:hypothetical protein
MSKRALSGLVAVSLVAGGWYAFRPERIFINETVDEPFEVAAAVAATVATPVALQDAMPMEGELGEVQETMPVADDHAAPLASGAFHSNAHETVGTATIFRLPDGERVLRLTDFRTSNGPDVRVFLVAASDVNDNATVTRAGYIELGKLKGNRGNQNYDLPAEVDLAKYRSVTIWCHRFSVNFGTAPLTAARS